MNIYTIPSPEMHWNGKNQHFTAIIAQCPNPMIFQA